jgi:N-acetyl-anhydromuramyl-L-alanine amidase AmpD/V8-like Glu-specific endopeptidase
MPAQIRANRLDVTDRFPMLGYTIRTEASPHQAEVVLTTDPALLLPQNKARRTSANFHSTRGGPALVVQRGEAVYLVPPEVLLRFVGQSKLFVALAVTPQRAGAATEIAALPDAQSPYVSLAGLSGRSLQRVRLLPTRQQRAAGWAGDGGVALEWAGDTALPGTEKADPADAAKGANGGAPRKAVVDYDDGFGPLPVTPAAPATPAAPSAPPMPTAPAAQAAAAEPGIEGPIPDLPEPPAAAALEAETPDYPRASRFVAAHRGNQRAPRGARRVERLVIHITDGGPNIAGPISWFRNTDSGVSAHYIVGRDGEVVQMVRHDRVAHHAGSANETSIGIEHVANTRGLNPTEAQLDASAALVAWLAAQCGVPLDRDHVLGHAEADPSTGHRACPNAVWNWDDYMRRVAAAASAAAAQDLSAAQQEVLPRALEIIQPFYHPADPMSALTCQNDAFSLAREEWFVGVPNTTIFPHSAICLLEMKDAAGRIASRGTGFYIGPRRILTCAHNLHGQASVDIVPANNDSTEPYGRCNVAASSWRVSNRYPRDGHRFDLAVIDNVPIAAPGGRWFEFLQATPGPQMEVVVCGYSSRSELVPELTRAINGRMQHLHAGYVASADDETFDYPILTLKRASGSPVYHIARDANGALQAYVCGVHVSGEPAARGLNRGCFLTPTKLDWIEGRTSTLGLAARAQEIPLDPGAGGRSIGIDALAAGDIIVSTSRHPVSYAIRGGTLSAVSHAMLYVGEGRVIEAVASGVREVPLATAIADAILAVAYRDPRVTTAIAAAIVAHARSRVGQPYNYAGAAFNGYRILNPLPATIIDRIASRLGLEVGQAGAAYCSELMFEAYEQAGVPLTATRPGASTPEDIVELRRSALAYVGHLVAEDFPLGIPLGMPLAAAQALPRALDVSQMTVGSERRPVTPPSVRRLGTVQRAALEAALLAFAGPLAPLIAAARAAAPAAQVSIGIGRAVGAGLGAGGTFGAGVIFASDGGIGVYGAGEIDIGFIASISDVVQVTVVRGGIESFNGWGLAAAISGGEGIVAGAAALFDMAGTFQGVSVQAGVGVGLSPVDFYIGIQRQVATQLSLSLAHTMGAEVAPPAATAAAPVAPIRRVVTGTVAGASWQLEQQEGMRAPPQAAPAAATSERRVRLDDWPYLDLAGGPMRLPMTLAWRYRGGAVGDVRFEVETAQTQPGCMLTVSAQIADGPDSAGQFAQRVTIRHVFACEGRPEVGALTTLTLYGDGTYERQDRWEQPMALAA